jgi:ElaA protein
MKSAKQQVPDNSDLQWGWHSLAEMESVLLYDMLALREAIFVVEQSCIYQELDGLDKIARHLLVTHNGTVVACLRVLPANSQETRVRIGRVAVSPAWRGTGIARKMMQVAVEKIRQDDPLCGIFLAAQTYLQGFYQSLGFQLCGDEFLEDGIPHVPMQMRASAN